MSWMAGTGHTGQQGLPPQMKARMLTIALQAKGISAEVTELWDGFQIETYEVRLPFGVAPRKVMREADMLALTAGAEMCRVSQRRDTLILEFPKPVRERTTLTAAQMLDGLRRRNVRLPNSWSVPLGLGVARNVVWLDFSDERMAHVAIGGTTRSGKSCALHWVLSRLLVQNEPRDLRLLMLDPKGKELEPFTGSRHLLHAPQSRTVEILKVLWWVRETIDDRGRRGIKAPRILVVIEELKELADRASSTKEDVASIAQLGAGAGVHLLLTSQHPTSGSLGDAVVNCPARLLGRTASATLSYGAAGRAKSQAEMLLGRGDFVLLTEGGQMQRVQVPLVGNEELDRIPKQEGETPGLELPVQVDWSEDENEVDSRGGWNRKPLDMDVVRRLVEKGATAADLRDAFGINYHRADRLRERFGG